MRKQKRRPHNEYNVDDCLAATYQESWYIGQIIEVDTEDGDSISL